MVWSYDHKLFLKNGNIRNGSITCKGLEGEDSRQSHNVIKGGDLKCDPDNGYVVLWKFTSFVCEGDTEEYV